jgi:RND superfamily putative drug exporter
MLEDAFRRLGRFSQKNSGKLIVAWVIALIVLGPFAPMLFSETSYNLSSGIFPSNSMSAQAQRYLSEYFPNDASAGNQSLVVVTTGTDVNSPAVISNFNTMQSGISGYLKSNGINGSVTSILTVENSTLSGISTGAKIELNATYIMLYQTNFAIYELNSTLNQTLQMIYGVPSLFLHNYAGSGNNSSAANTETLSQLSSTGALVNAYYKSFYSFWNNSSISVVSVRADYSVNQAVNNQTSSNYYTLSVQQEPLHIISVSLLQNFSLSDYSPATANDRAHYDAYAYRYTLYAILPSLDSNKSVSSFINSDLNITSVTFFNDAFYLPQPASPSKITAQSVGLVAKGLESTLRLNPYVAINVNAVSSYLFKLNGSNDVASLVPGTLLSSGFIGYPFVPSAYVYHQFVGYDNSTTIMIVTTSANLTSAQSDSVSSVIHSSLAKIAGSNYYLAGSSQQNRQLSSETLTGMVRALIIGIILSIIIVGLYFRSVTAAFLPLLMFAASATAAFSVNALLYKYVLRTSVSFITPTLLLILLLGLSSDYVVYMMSRFRRELRNGNSNPAIISTQWAGHAIFTSGVTVAVSYAALYAANVPLFSDSGITNAIGVLIAVLVANTLLVSILNIARSKIYWPAKIVAGVDERKTVMYRISQFVISNKVKIVVIFLVAAMLGAYIYASTPTNMDVFDLLPSGSGIKAIEVATASFHGDPFDIGYIIVQFPSPVVTGNGTYNAAEISQITAIEQTIASHSQITQVQGPTFPFGYYVPYNLTGIPATYQSAYSSQMKTFIGHDSRFVRLTFELSSLSWRQPASNFVSSLVTIIHSTVGGSYSLYVGGLTEGFNNAYSYTSSSFNRLVPVLALAILAVLSLQLSSIFTPARLILMVLSSVVLSLAITYIALYYVLHMPIVIFLPMFTVITLLAVGLDYDIFMVTRVREEVVRGKSDQDGIVTSITENGGVIITLGSLLFATFGSLAFSGIGIMEEIGVGLAVGVLVDTFISWPFFVPAVMLYLRKYNWWPSKIGQGRHVVYRRLSGKL